MSICETKSENVDVSHHIQYNLCKTRPPYRQGRNLTAVKVYTVANESQHLHIYGVPKINLRNELKAICIKYGQITTLHVVKNPVIPQEAFTECYHICYQRIQSARIAKKFLDNKSFYGGVLHVCYTPEHERIEELKYKLEQRRYDVLKKLQGDKDFSSKPNFSEIQKNFSALKEMPRKRKRPAIEITDERMAGVDPMIAWNDIPKELDPRVTVPDSHKERQDVPMKHYVQSETEIGKIKNESLKIKVKIPIKSRNVYGPHLPTNVVLNQGNNSDEEVKTYPLTKGLIPTQVVLSKEYVYKCMNQKPANKIVFRK